VSGADGPRVAAILQTMAVPKEPVPLWRWVTWFSIMGAALVVFYVLLTPIWLGLRGLAWLADKRSRHG
jgi:hypothetical protein